MKIEIEDNKTISQVQETFNKQFPNLRLEFFTRPHGEGMPSKRTNMIDNKMYLRDCRTIHTQGTIEIQKTDTISKVEKLFEKNFGLSVQVMRRSGKVWLVTTTSDEWTFEEQNKYAKEIQ